jgi:hypothetical protein
MKKEEEITIQEYECENGCGVCILKGKKQICSECGGDIICHCGENIKSEKPICLECCEEIYGWNRTRRCESEYGPEEIEEEHARIRRNNNYNKNNSYNEEEYNPYRLEVNTSFTLGSPLSNGGKRLLR